MYYIQESDKPNKLIGFLNIIKLKEEEILLPITNKNINEKKEYKLAINTKKILEGTNSNKLVLSKEVKGLKNYTNYLYSYNYDIVDGIWLFKILTYDVLQYIIDKIKLKKENIKIGFLINETSDLAIYNIKKLVEEYKSVNIVTNHIEKFKNIENKIYEEKGILINVSNNKRKALSKVNVVLNFDFPTELINRYNINSEATIVNFQGNVKIKDKRFNGLCINDYEIICNKEDMEKHENKFFVKDLYEAVQYKNQPVEESLKKIKKNNVKIRELKAINTVI